MNVFATEFAAPRRDMTQLASSSSIDTYGWRFSSNFGVNPFCFQVARNLIIKRFSIGAISKDFLYSLHSFKRVKMSTKGRKFAIQMKKVDLNVLCVSTNSLSTIQLLGKIFFHLISQIYRD